MPTFLQNIKSLTGLVTKPLKSCGCYWSIFKLGKSKSDTTTAETRCDGWL